MFMLLFLVLLIWFLIKVIILAMKLTWGIGKICFYIIFIPLMCIFLLMAGFVFIPIFILIIAFIFLKWIVD